MADLPDVRLDTAPACPGAGHPGPAHHPQAAQPARAAPVPPPAALVVVPPPAPAQDQAPGPAPAAARPEAFGAAPGDQLPAAGLDGEPLAVTETAWLTLRHWAAQWWQAVCKAVTNPRGPWHARPESLADHDAYRRSRAWVPPGHQGAILGPAGAAYHHTFARFGLLTGYLWAWVWARPLRLAITLAVCGAIFLGFWLG